MVTFPVIYHLRRAYWSLYLTKRWVVTRLCIAHRFTSGYPGGLIGGCILLSPLPRAPSRRPAQISEFPRRGGGEGLRDFVRLPARRICPSTGPRKKLTRLVNPPPNVAKERTFLREGREQWRPGCRKLTNSTVSLTLHPLSVLDSNVSSLLDSSACQPLKPFFRQRGSHPNQLTSLFLSTARSKGSLKRWPGILRPPFGLKSSC